MSKVCWMLALYNFTTWAAAQTHAGKLRNAKSCAKQFLVIVHSPRYLSNIFWHWNNYYNLRCMLSSTLSDLFWKACLSWCGTFYIPCLLPPLLSPDVFQLCLVPLSIYCIWGCCGLLYSICLSAVFDWFCSFLLAWLPVSWSNFVDLLPAFELKFLHSGHRTSALLSLLLLRPLLPILYVNKTFHQPNPQPLCLFGRGCV